MTDNEETASPIVNRDLFPATDEKVLTLIPDFAWAVARASAATVWPTGFSRSPNTRRSLKVPPPSKASALIPV